MPDCKDVFQCDRIEWKEEGNLLVGYCACHPNGAVAQRPKPKKSSKKQVTKESDNGNS